MAFGPSLLLDFLNPRPLTPSLPFSVVFCYFFLLGSMLLVKYSPYGGIPLMVIAPFVLASTLCFIAFLCVLIFLRNGLTFSLSGPSEMALPKGLTLPFSYVGGPPFPLPLSPLPSLTPLSSLFSRAQESPLPRPSNSTLSSPPMVMDLPLTRCILL